MRILLAIDGSPSSDAAVDEVCRRPWPAGTEVRVLTVLFPEEFNRLREAPHPATFDDIFEQSGWKTVRFMVDAVTKPEQRAPDLSVTPVLMEGRPKDAILDYDENWCSDLIVVGSHGYGKIRHFFLGSVSLAIALNAPCSVEIVRSPSERLRGEG